MRKDEHKRHSWKATVKIFADKVESKTIFVNVPCHKDCPNARACDRMFNIASVEKAAAHAFGTNAFAVRL